MAKTSQNWPKLAKNWPKLRILGLEKKGEVGIERMVDEGAYSGAFPLHDVSKMKKSIIESQKIGQNWSKLAKT